MKVNAVTFDETKYYNITDEDKPFIRQIRGVYAYDPEAATYACEITPSYDMRFLHSYIVLQDDVSDSKREELDERYCYTGENDDMLMHVADVRQFARDHPCSHKECGEFDSMEDACEHLNGNWPF